MARLVVISGLPGVGKTSIARAFALQNGFVHLSIDPVEEAMLSSGVQAGWDVGVAAYEAVRVMTELNLAVGHHVVVDAVNDSEEARQTWHAAAARSGAQLDFVHLVVSDAAEHQKRLEARDRGFTNIGEPTWEQVQGRRSAYAAWSDEVLEIDTADRTVEEMAGTLTARLLRA